MISRLKLFLLTLVNPENGALMIVDRKKDLVKLQMGEYVSLGKVENALKLHPVVENVCVFASPLKTTTVALIVPDEVTLRQIHDREHGSSSPVTPSRSVQLPQLEFLPATCGMVFRRVEFFFSSLLGTFQNFKFF